MKLPSEMGNIYIDNINYVGIFRFPSHLLTQSTGIYSYQPNLLYK